MMAMRARVVVRHARRVPENEAPLQIGQLVGERWKGRVVIARPGFGTTRGHMAALVRAWGGERARAWMRGMKANGVRFVDGNSAVVRAVAQGEAHIGLTDTDDVWSGKRQGWPVEMTLIGHGDDAAHGAAGPLWIPNSAGLVAGGPDRESGTRLLEFLLSADVDRLLAAHESKHVPLHEDTRGEFAHATQGPDPARSHAEWYEGVADSMDEAMKLCREEWAQ